MNTSLDQSGVEQHLFGFSSMHSPADFSVVFKVRRGTPSNAILHEKADWQLLIRESKSSEEAIVAYLGTYDSTDRKRTIKRGP